MPEQNTASAQDTVVYAGYYQNADSNFEYLP